jgi:hypothetical protein
MADFSKQWCELYDPEMTHDFDILEEFEKLEPDQYINYICEGFGFIAIGKTQDNQCLLAIPIDGDPHGNILWKKYDDVIV